jgi:glycosyltransferase involved in cell wall biosynthesis
MFNKGVHVLLEALRGLEVRAVIVGFGDYRAELERIAPPRVLFTGPLEHRHLVNLLPLADATVVPSIFPEAFGMVAAEAAASGSPPLVARHSGLAEVAEGLEAEYPPDLRHLASFATGDARDLRAKLNELLALAPGQRADLGARARRAAESRWSWAGVAARLLEPLG